MTIEPKLTEFTYVDVPEVRETFADSIGGMAFDGTVVRVEFTVSWLSPVKAGEP